MGEVAAQIPMSFGHELRASLRFRRVKTWLRSGIARILSVSPMLPPLTSTVYFFHLSINIRSSSPTTNAQKANQNENKTNSLYSLALAFSFPDSSIGENYRHLISAGTSLITFFVLLVLFIFA
ncbi:hypothetical protein YC2023_026601 [Brassica napus]